MTSTKRHHPFWPLAGTWLPSTKKQIVIHRNYKHLKKASNFAKEFSRLDENFFPEISEFTERIDASRHSTGQL